MGSQIQAASKELPAKDTTMARIHVSKANTTPGAANLLWQLSVLDSQGSYTKNSLAVMAVKKILPQRLPDPSPSKDTNDDPSTRYHQQGYCFEAFTGPDSWPLGRYHSRGSGSYSPVHRATGDISKLSYDMATQVPEMMAYTHGRHTLQDALRLT